LLQLHYLRIPLGGAAAVDPTVSGQAIAFLDKYPLAKIVVLVDTSSIPTGNAAHNTTDGVPRTASLSMVHSSPVLILPCA
jgi:hypothetical protein